MKKTFIRQALRLSTLAVAISSLGVAHAADPANGKLLYEDMRGADGDSCASCHNANPARNVSKVMSGANNAALIQTAISFNMGGMNEFVGKFSTAELQDIAAYLGTCNTSTRVCTVPTAAAKIALSSASVTFASTALTTASSAQTLTVSNAGNAALSLSSISLGGSNPGDFTTGGTCSTASPVAAGGSCSVTVGFTPQAVGSRSATLTVASSIGNVTASLSGTGAAAPAPIAAVSTSSVNFGAVVLGGSASAQTVTVSNSGTANLTLSSIATGSAEFPLKGGTCATSSPVAPGASCTVGLGFVPSAAGARSGTLTVANNGAGGPLTVSLSGSGTAQTPVAQVSPGALSFSQTVGQASAAQTVTVSNTGTGPLSVSSVGLSGLSASDYAIAGGTTCTAGATVAVNNNCVIKLVFTPSSTGTRAATLNVAHNAAGSPGTVSLNGTGGAVPTGTLTLNQSSLSFAATALGASSQQSVTLGNNGNAPLTLTGLSVGGANAGEFSVGGNCTVGAQIPVGSSCAVTVTFAPNAAGARTGNLTIATSNASNPSAALSLNGTAVAAAAPVASVSTTALDLGSTTVGQTSSARSFTLQNTGNAPLTVSAIVASPSGFAQTSNCGASLAAGASCAVNVTFSPSAVGAATGAVTITTNAAGSPIKVGLSASGASAPVPSLSWSQALSAVKFADTNVGSAAPTQTFTLVNAGPGSATLTQVQKGGANAGDFTITGSTCANGSALAAGGSCTLGVAFQPSAAGARSATLTVTSNAGGPNSLTLSGNGVAVAAPALTVAPSAINLVSSTAGVLSKAQALTLTNAGTGSLRINSIMATPRIWVLTRKSPDGGSCARAPFTLSAGQSCTLQVFGLSGLSAINGKVLVSSSASATPLVVPVTSTARYPSGCASVKEWMSHLCDKETETESESEKD